MWTGAKLCLAEAIHRALKHEDWFALESQAKLTEYLWLINPRCGLDSWYVAGISQFGMPKLFVAMKLMSFTLPELGIEETSGLVRMSKGEPCHPRCQEGCVHG